MAAAGVALPSCPAEAATAPGGAWCGGGDPGNPGEARSASPAGPALTKAEGRLNAAPRVRWPGRVAKEECTRGNVRRERKCGWRWSAVSPTTSGAGLVRRGAREVCGCGR